MHPSQKRFLELHQQGYERASKGDVAGANAAYEEALSVMEDGVEYYTATAVRANLAQNHAALGDLDAAWEHAGPALEGVRQIANDQMRGQVLNQLAWLLYEHGGPMRHDEALGLADDALDLVPEGIKLATMDTRMRILIALGRLAEAKEVARVALEAAPDNPDFQDVKQRWFTADADAAPAPAASGGSTVPPIPSGGGLTPIPY